MSTATIIGCLSILAGLAITLKALKVMEALRRYELRHTTPGGVQFPTYEASKRHQAAKSMWSLVAAAGVAAVALGLLIFLRS